MTQAFPLQWPAGWQRTPQASRTYARYKIGFVHSLKQLKHSLSLLGAYSSSIIVSTNVPLRRNGEPYADEGLYDDPGVAVYWNSSKHTERVIACDRWLGVHENIRAIGVTIDALRSIERAGATQVLDQAFTAFGALPPAIGAVPVRSWWEVLGLSEALLVSLSLPMVKARYRELAAKAHPDRTGSDAAMAELTRALSEAEAYYLR